MGSTPSFIVGEDVYVKGRVFGKGKLNYLYVLIPQGSFGKVYLMKHKATGKNRVFKEMSKAEILRKSKGSVQMLIREREFLSTVHGCPYVIKCYGLIFSIPQFKSSI
jgi:serine/threonine protein kinase